MREGAPPLLEVQRRLSYQFRQPDLLQLALTHPSYAHEHPEVGGGRAPQSASRIPRRCGTGFPRGRLAIPELS